MRISFLLIAYILLQCNGIDKRTNEESFVRRNKKIITQEIELSLEEILSEKVKFKADYLHVIPVKYSTNELRTSEKSERTVSVFETSIFGSLEYTGFVTNHHCDDNKSSIELNHEQLSLFNMEKNNIAVPCDLSFLSNEKLDLYVFPNGDSIVFIQGYSGLASGKFATIERNLSIKTNYNKEKAFLSHSGDMPKSIFYGYDKSQNQILFLDLKNEGDTEDDFPMKYKVTICSISFESGSLHRRDSFYVLDYGEKAKIVNENN